MTEVLINTNAGLYCPAGDFYIDPWKGVKRAVITHAHSDHARWGSQHYLAAQPSQHLLNLRLPGCNLQVVPYGQPVRHQDALVSFHPAGHMLGSAQVRIEVQGRVAVVTGDYKLGTDATCQSWEPIRCDLFVTESTFGLPVYRWPDQQQTFDQINAWWNENARSEICSILYGYAIGKSQRLLAGLDPSIGPIYTHGAVEKGNEAYRATGVQLPHTIPVPATSRSTDFRGSIVIAVPSAHGTPWMRRFGTVSTAMASGWMMIRGAKRRRAMDRGFILSDHVDWPSLNEAVALSNAQQVWITHGSSHVVAKYLREQGYDARSIDTKFGTEEDDLDANDLDANDLDADNETIR
jgi:putative mRNA 3-end processing factor